MKQIVFSVLFFLLFSILRAQSDTSMVLIPGGVFIMGKDMANGLGFSPAHLVKIDSFFMDKHELSNRQYFEFCQATGHKLPEFWNTELFRSGTNRNNFV